MIAAAMDHGYNNPTCWLWAAVDRDGRIIVFDEHYRSGMIVREHAKVVHARNEFWGRVPSYYVGDPSIRNTDPITGTSIHIEYAESGVPIVLGVNDQKAGINRVARYLTGINNIPKLYICSNCENTVRELGRLRWASWANKKDEKKKNKKEEQHKKDDHAADTVRYLVASRPENNDDGTQVPSQPDYFTGSRAIGEDRELYDWGLENRSRNSDYSDVGDSQMGAEW
jgi:hypothetical protein